MLQLALVSQQPGRQRMVVLAEEVAGMLHTKTAMRLVDCARTSLGLLNLRGTSEAAAGNCLGKREHVDGGFGMEAFQDLTLEVEVGRKVYPADNDHTHWVVADSASDAWDVLGRVGNRVTVNIHSEEEVY